MSGCNVVIKFSRWRQLGLLALASVLFLIFCLQPFQPLLLALAAPMLCWLYWYGLTRYQRGLVATGLSVQADGQLRWLHSEQPGGQLLTGSLVSQFALLLRWQDQDNRQYQQWLLADQLTEADYRALARLLNQLNWQALGAKIVGSANGAKSG